MVRPKVRLRMDFILHLKVHVRVQFKEQLKVHKKLMKESIWHYT